MYKNLIHILLVTASLLTACSRVPATIGDRMIQEGTDIERLGKNWSHAQDLVELGQKRIKHGSHLIHKGEQQIKEGQKMVEKGNQMLAKSEARYIEQRTEKSL